jgi:hypothetical protein
MKLSHVAFDSQQVSMSTAPSQAAPMQYNAAALSFKPLPSPHLFAIPKAQVSRTSQQVLASCWALHAGPEHMIASAEAFNT